MRRSLTLLAAAAALAFPANAAAIMGGSPDGDGHPSVGALLEPGLQYVNCTGTLISPTVFLTAAHCADAQDQRVRVSFVSAYHPGDRSYAGTLHYDPAYPGPSGDPHDIAVVVLDRALTRQTSKLPKAGSLSKLPADQRFTSVGYGASDVSSGPGGKTITYEDTRLVATGTLNSITQNWLKISQNPSHGDGGTCYGDSGGPNFLGTSNTIAATTITGDTWCRSTNVDFRLDTPAARAFLESYVALP